VLSHAADLSGGPGDAFSKRPGIRAHGYKLASYNRPNIGEDNSWSNAYG